MRRDKLRIVVIGILGFLTLIWLFGKKGGSKQGGGWTAANIPKVAIGSGPPVVIVTVVDPKAESGWIEKIKNNRQEYAKRHGMVGTPTERDTSSINTHDRLLDFLPPQRPIPPPLLPFHLVSCPRHATRNDLVPWLNLLLVP